MPLLTTAVGRFCYFNKPPVAAAPAPTITEQSFGFTYIGNSYSEPYTSFTQTDGTNYSWLLFQASTEFGSYEEIATGSSSLPGSTTITYFGETFYEYWFYYKVTVTNATESATYETIKLQNIAPYFEA